MSEETPEAPEDLAVIEGLKRMTARTLLRDLRGHSAQLTYFGSSLLPSTEGLAGKTRVGTRKSARSLSVHIKS